MTDVTQQEIKFSAIIPNYNSAEFLSRAIQSLLDQKDAFTEIIIVDDGSTDNSVDIIHAFMRQHPNILLIQHAVNQGVNAALIHGIKQAQGDYILLGAADDIYHDKMVAVAKQAIQAHPEAGFICGNAIVHRYDLKEAFYRPLPFPKNTFVTADAFKAITKKQYVGFNAGGGMLMKREAVIAAGLLYPQLRWHADWMLYFAIALQNGFYYADETFITIYMRQAGYSEGKHAWPAQRQVMIETVELYQKHYPGLWQDFKAAALLPNYSLRCLPLFLFNSRLRQFFTLKLLWKFFINNTMVVRVGRLFPYRVILNMRKLLRA